MLIHLCDSDYWAHSWLMHYGKVVFDENVRIWKKRTFSCRKSLLLVAIVENHSPYQAHKQTWENQWNENSFKYVSHTHTHTQENLWHSSIDTHTGSWKSAREQIYCHIHSPPHPPSSQKTEGRCSRKCCEKFPLRFSMWQTPVDTARVPYDMSLKYELIFFGSLYVNFSDLLQ